MLFAESVLKLIVLERLDKGIEVTKLFMHVYDRSMEIESKTPNNSLLSNDGVVCSNLIKARVSQS